MTQMDAGTGEQVKEKAGEVAGQAQERAQQAAGQLRDQARTQIDQRSTDAGRRVGDQAGDLRAVGDELRRQGKDRPARLVDQAAQHVERAGGWLQDSDADAILHDVEDAARKNPWAVVAGGVVLGFAASRFLKASSSDRYRTRGLGPDSHRVALPASTATGPDQRFTRPAAPAASAIADPPAGTPQVPPPMGPGAL